jgi:hypothetical protein
LYDAGRTLMGRCVFRPTFVIKVMEIWDNDEAEDGDVKLKMSK